MKHNCFSFYITEIKIKKNKKIIVVFKSDISTIHTLTSIKQTRHNHICQTILIFPLICLFNFSEVSINLIICISYVRKQNWSKKLWHWIFFFFKMFKNNSRCQLFIYIIWVLTIQIAFIWTHCRMYVCISFFFIN